MRGQGPATFRDYTPLSPAAERIVDAAEALIKHQGFNGFSYEGIAQALAMPLLSALEGAMMAGAAGPRPMHRPRLCRKCDSPWCRPRVR
jgi:hypothetical protein